MKGLKNDKNEWFDVFMYIVRTNTSLFSITFTQVYTVIQVRFFHYSQREVYEEIIKM